MTVCIVAQLKFTDRAAYDRYQARFMDVFGQFKGRLLAADERRLSGRGARRSERSRERGTVHQLPCEPPT